jgi:hypothetical protein
MLGSRKERSSASALCLKKTKIALTSCVSPWPVNWHAGKACVTVGKLASEIQGAALPPDLADLQDHTHIIGETHRQTGPAQRAPAVVCFDQPEKNNLLRGQ